VAWLESTHPTPPSRTPIHPHHPLHTPPPLPSHTTTTPFTHHHSPLPSHHPISPLSSPPFPSHLTQVLAINQDTTPAGQLLSPSADAATTDDHALLYTRHLSDGSVALALYNPNDAAAPAPVVEFATLGWASDAAAAVRDLWAHADNGTATGRYPPPSQPPINVAPHATVLLRLTPQKQ
jgi:hypothetical protein